MRISDVLKIKGTDVTTLRATASVRELVAILAERRIGAVLVSADGRAPAGMVSERDVVRQLARSADELMDTAVGDIMTTEVVMCSPDENVDAVLQTMTERRFRHIPVLQDGTVVGIVSIGDLVKGRIDELSQERDQLSNYISGSG